MSGGTGGMPGGMGNFADMIAGANLLVSKRYMGQEGAGPDAPVHSHGGGLGVTGFLMQDLSAKPPMLMIHGEKDELVPINQSELLYAALSKTGVRTKMVRVANADHGFSAATPGAVVSPGLEEIKALEVQWFKEILDKK